MSVNREIHSVIVNLNKNYSNNKGSDFSTIVNRQLEIKPNTEVALYCGQISRPTIVIDSDISLNIDFTSSFPTTAQLGLSQIALNTLRAPTLNSALIKAGTYSKSSFCKQLCYKINQAIDSNMPSNITPINGSLATCDEQFSYLCYYKLDGDNFYLGLRYSNYQALNPTDGNPPKSEPYRLGILDLNDGLTTTSNIGIITGGRNNDILALQSDSGATNWNSYVLGNSPVRGMGYTTTEDKPTIESDVAFVSAHVLGEPATFTGDSGFVFGLNNTWLSENWGAAGATTVGTVNLKDGSTPTPAVPQSLIGAYFDVTSDGTNFTKQKIKLYANPRLYELDNANLYASAAKRTEVATEDVRLLGEFDMTEYELDFSRGSLFRYEIYCRDIFINFADTGANDDNFDNDDIEKTRRYYFKFMASNPYVQGQSAVLYDSFADGFSIHKDVVESGYLWQQLDAPADDTKQVSGGLCPQFYWNQADRNITVTNCRANNIASLTSPADGSGVYDNFVINKGLLNYAFAIPKAGTNSNLNSYGLENVLGLVAQDAFKDGLDVIPSEVSYKPNIYPYCPEEAGLTKLNSDLNRYNIEVNLPVRAYNNTASVANDIGQTRTIIYNTPPVVEDITGTAQAVQHLSIQPNDTKYLSLNNPEPVKLNSLDIKIRRAKTNEIATEITDCSLELLFRKE